MSAEDVRDAYLDDLGLAPAPPSLAALTEIVRRHVARHAFASIGPRLGDDLPLDPDELLDRIVRRQRGGYCFEQNGLLFAVLTNLGYDTRLQMARVLVSGASHPPLTHRVTRVLLDGTDYLVDVGFGPLGPPFPIALRAAPESEARYRVVRQGDVGYQLEVLDGDVWKPLYRFDDVPYGEADAELGHFYSHRHPEASFVNNLVASRILEGEVRSLRNREYHVIRPDGTDVEIVTDAERLHQILTEDLRLSVSTEETQRLWSALDTSAP